MKLTVDLMMKAFGCLDQKLKSQLRLVVGGGGAMLLAHKFPLATSDIDAVPTGGLSLEELQPLINEVAEELSLAGDWLNPYYASFVYVLPSDYGDRLIEVVKLKHLTVLALSKTDLLLMKCFAGRQKDVVHARALLKGGADSKLVRLRISELKSKNLPGSERAEKFLEEIEAFFKDQEDE